MSHSFTVASWNVNSLRVRLDQVAGWLETHQPAVLCLQETKLSDAEFPHDALAEVGYHAAFTGQKSYNGVATLTRQEASKVTLDLPHFDDEQRRFVALDVPLGNGETVRVVNVYVPNGQSLESDKFVYKRAWFNALTDALESMLASYANVLLLGDFNITPTDLDVHDPAAWRGKIHCSDTERLMLHRLMSKGLYDTYRAKQSQGEHFSWWDYRGAGYRANAGLRIDLVLSSGAMLQRLQSASIDETPRRHERPSDHTPVVAEFTAE